MTTVPNKLLRPLSWNVPISDQSGLPTLEFMRKWADLIKMATDLKSTFDAALAAQTLADNLTKPEYVTLATDTNLLNERVLTAGAGIHLADAGAGGAVTISSQGGSGFGFSIGGLPGDGEICGFAPYPTDLVFTNGDPLTKVESEFPATATTVFTLQTWVAGVRTIVGTITFAAGSSSTTVVWSSSPYTLPAFTILELHAQSPSDGSLAWITGTINGVPA